MVAEHVTSLFKHVRKGELGEIKEILDADQVDLDVCDQWNNTPLYLACLCQHKAVVAYLLEKGAQYESSSAQGQRCFLAAADPDIRELLKKYSKDEETKKKNKKNKKKDKSKSPRLDNYRKFLLRLKESPSTADVQFEVSSSNNSEGTTVSYKAHRCVLIARCPFLANCVNNLTDKATTVPVDFLENADTFPHVLDYLYTAQTSFPADMLDDMISTANKLELCQWAKALKQHTRNNKKENATKVIYMGNGDEVKRLKADLGWLALGGLPYNLEKQLIKHGRPGNDGHSPDMFPDVVFSVEEHMFMGHKAFLCESSKILKDLVSKVISEKSISSSALPMVQLSNITAEAFAQIMVYIYSDCCSLSKTNIVGVMSATKKLKLMELHYLCNRELQHHLAVDNVVTALRLVRELKQKKLVKKCTEFMAEHLTAVLKEDEFSNLLKEDKDSKKTGNTSQLELIEDIGYYIRQDAHTADLKIKANDKIEKFNQYLKEFDISPVESIMLNEDSEESEGSMLMFGVFDTEPYSNTDKNGSTNFMTNQRKPNGQKKNIVLHSNGKKNKASSNQKSMKNDQSCTCAIL